MTNVKCPKCGAQIEIEPGVSFVKCEYCESMIFVDKSGVMFYYVLPFFFDKTKALETFKRWTAGSKMAKDLESKAQIVEVRKQFFPVYMFKRDVNGKEEVIVRPARGTVLPGLYDLKIPGGDIKIFDANFNPGDATVLDVDIPMDQYLPQLPGTPKEQALVYFPIYLIYYNYGQYGYSVVIDGSTGAVHASNYPPRSSVPYGLVTAMGFGISFIGAAIGIIIDNGLLCITSFLVAFLVSLGAGLYVAKNM